MTDTHHKVITELRQEVKITQIALELSCYDHLEKGRATLTPNYYKRQAEDVETK